jgi:hypothetical protein
VKKLGFASFGVTDGTVVAWEQAAMIPSSLAG